jgi:ribonuclease Z
MIRLSNRLPRLLLAAGLFAGVLLSPASAQIANPAAADLFDGQALRVVLCGTSGPLPDPARAKSCTLIIAGEAAYVVDTGPESWEQIARMAIPGVRIAGIFLTHYHSDHIGELGEFRMQTMVAGRSVRLPVYGPPGVEEVVDGFNQAYRFDKEHRLAHHGAQIINAGAADLVARPFGADLEWQGSGEVVVLEDAGLKVTAFEVDHDPVKPAVGYRFEWRGRSVVVTGDAAKSDNLVENARNADVLVGDSLAASIILQAQRAAQAGGNSRQAKLLTDIPDYHASPVELAEMANGANVGLLVYSHFVPPLQATTPLYFAGVQAVRPQDKWVAGYDGLRIDLPASSTDIRQSGLLPKP